MLGRALGWSVAIAFAAALTYGFYSVWEAHVRASISGADLPGSEARLIIAAILASGLTLGATALSWWDRRKSLRNERQKKGFELRTEAAFEMWGAATTAYRLLSKAETGGFSRNKAETIQKALVEAERNTLLFEGDLISAFQAFWQATDALSEAMLAARADQASVWKDGIKRYADKYNELKGLLSSELKE
ncbi:MAG TPA: hypothetical protein VD887_07210 [Allosphingosinicella sp.]|nr:hypothetical protein [Allosphingosinicella sp.]